VHDEWPRREIEAVGAGVATETLQQLVWPWFETFMLTPAAQALPRRDVVTQAFVELLLWFRGVML